MKAHSTAGPSLLFELWLFYHCVYCTTHTKSGFNQGPFYTWLVFIGTKKLRQKTHIQKCVEINVDKDVYLVNSAINSIMHQ